MREFCPDSSYFRLQWGTLWEGTVDWSSKELQHPEQASHQWILSHCDHVWSDPAADRGLGRYHGGHHHNLRSLSSGWEEPVADHLYVVQPGLERLPGFYLWYQYVSSKVYGILKTRAVRLLPAVSFSILLNWKYFSSDGTWVTTGVWTVSWSIPGTSGYRIYCSITGQTCSDIDFFLFSVYWVVLVAA